MDEKGLTALIVCSLPPCVHETKERIGLAAGLSLGQSLRSEYKVAVALATGTILVAYFGNAWRQFPTTLGMSVNLAARIMVLPAAEEGVLVDQTTYEQCSSTFQFEMEKGVVKPRMFSPKGFRSAVPYYAAVALASKKKTKEISLVGRQNEKAVLRASVDSWLSQGSSSTHTLILEGASGMGKSALAAWLEQDIVDRKGKRTLVWL